MPLPHPTQMSPQRSRRAPSKSAALLPDLK
jgi:hypothetical protein